MEYLHLVAELFLIIYHFLGEGMGLWAVSAFVLLVICYVLYRANINSAFGCWHATYHTGDGTIVSEDLTFRGVGRWVWGNSNSSWDEAGRPLSVKYKVIGKIKGQHLVCRYYSYERYNLDSGAFVVRLTADNRGAKGAVIGYDIPQPGGNNAVESIYISDDYAWTRIA